MLRLTIREDAARASVNLAVISDRSCPPPASYLDKLRSVQGCKVEVSHISRGPTGLPTGYTVETPTGAIHLRPLLAVEAEPFDRLDPWERECSCGNAYTPKNPADGVCPPCQEARS